MWNKFLSALGTCNTSRTQERLHPRTQDTEKQSGHPVSGGPMTAEAGEIMLPYLSSPKDSTLPSIPPCPWTCLPSKAKEKQTGGGVCIWTWWTTHPGKREDAKLQKTAGGSGMPSGKPQHLLHRPRHQIKYCFWVCTWMWRPEHTLRYHSFLKSYLACFLFLCFEIGSFGDYRLANLARLAGQWVPGDPSPSS